MLLSGCCHLPSASRSAQRQSLPDSAAAEFSYQKPDEFICQAKEMQTKHQVPFERIQLAGVVAGPGPTQTNRTIELDYFRPQTKEKHPVLLILPMLGGSYPLEKYFASYFVKRGFAAIIVHREKTPEGTGLEVLNGMLKQSVLDNRQAIDWIETRPELDAQRIGIFGISMGAIKGALLVPLDSRIRAATLGLAGGDLPYILTQTTEKGIAKRREAILRNEHLTLPELHEKLGQCIQCDPNTYAAFVEPQKVLLILGDFDTVVPIKKGLELRQKMGKPETILVPTGHYTAILFVPYIQHQCYKFFQRKFRLPREQAQAASAK